MNYDVNDFAGMMGLFLNNANVCEMKIRNKKRHTYGSFRLYGYIV